MMRSPRKLFPRNHRDRGHMRPESIQTTATDSSIYCAFLHQHIVNLREYRDFAAAYNCILSSAESIE